METTVSGLNIKHRWGVHGLANSHHQNVAMHIPFWNSLEMTSVTSLFNGASNTDQITLTKRDTYMYIHKPSHHV